MDPSVSYEDLCLIYSDDWELEKSRNISFASSGSVSSDESLYSPDWESSSSEKNVWENCVKSYDEVNTEDFSKTSSLANSSFELAKSENYSSDEDGEIPCSPGSVSSCESVFPSMLGKSSGPDGVILSQSEDPCPSSNKLEDSYNLVCSESSMLTDHGHDICNEMKINFNGSKGNESRVGKLTNPPKSLAECSYNFIENYPVGQMGHRIGKCDDETFMDSNLEGERLDDQGLELNIQYIPENTEEGRGPQLKL